MPRTPSPHTPALAVIVAAAVAVCWFVRREGKRLKRAEETRRSISREANRQVRGDLLEGLGSAVLSTVLPRLRDQLANKPFASPAPSAWQTDRMGASGVTGGAPIGILSTFAEAAGAPRSPIEAAREAGAKEGALAIRRILAKWACRSCRPAGAADSQATHDLHH